jgi:hypothetical protein
MKLCQEIVPDDSLKVFVDASSGWGIGIVIGEYCEVFKWCGNWTQWKDGSKRDTAWAEFVAVQLAVLALIHDFKLWGRMSLSIPTTRQW